MPSPFASAQLKACSTKPFWFRSKCFERENKNNNNNCIERERAVGNGNSLSKVVLDIYPLHIWDVLPKRKSVFLFSRKHTSSFFFFQLQSLNSSIHPKIALNLPTQLNSFHNLFFQIEHIIEIITNFPV